MTIPGFSLPAEKTCIGSTELCRKYCYAKDAERRFPAVKPKRQYNLELSKSKGFIETIVNEIEQVPIAPYFRLHESGDFYSQKYFDDWCKIVKEFPKKTFLAFTKSFRLDFSNKPKNLNIYNSVWNDTDQALIKGSRFKKAYTVMTYKAFEGKNIKIDKAEQCKGYCDTCLMCFVGKENVFFNVH
jgi:hypothetical protein